MGISAGPGAVLGAGARLLDGTGGGGVLVTSSPTRSMRVLRLLVELLPAADRRRALLGKKAKSSEQTQCAQEISREILI